MSSHLKGGRNPRRIKSIRKGIDWIAEMQKIIDRKKRNGLVGLHLDLGLVPGERCPYSKQDVAKAFVTLERMKEKGLLHEVDVTNEVL